MWLDWLWLAVPAYVAVQGIAIARSTGTSRVFAAAAPLLVMAPVWVFTAVAFAQGSNLWPLWLLWSSPLALLYVTPFAVAGRTWGSRRPPRR